MGCRVEYARMHCSVSEVSFGPQCDSDDEAEALIGHIRRTRGRDPRIVDRTEIDRALAELRSGAEVPTHPDMLCVCGSGQLRGGMMWTRGKLYIRCSHCTPPGPMVFDEDSFTEVPADRRAAIEATQ